MHRALRPTVRMLALAAALTLVAGCAGTSNGGDGTALPTYDPSADASASAGGTTAATATAATGLGYTPADPDGIGATVVFTDFTPKDATARAVYADFQEVSRYQMQVINQGEFDMAVLRRLTAGQVQSGFALAAAQRRVGRLGTKKYADRLFTVGEYSIKTLKITRRGRTATITFCAKDRTYEVDQAGKSINIPVGNLLDQIEYRLIDGRWKASKIISSKRGGCSY